MEKLSFKLAVFEGPLDALLYLISKNKLDIYEVSISDLLNQYLEYLNEMRQMNLEIASEFLEMASRLVQIKSSMLLPKDENEKSEKEEFLQTLIEYKTCKEMAEALKNINGGFDTFVREPLKIDIEKTYTNKHDIKELSKIYLLMGNRIKRDRPPTADNFQGVVGVPIVSVASKVVHIIKSLIKGGKIKFNMLYRDVGTRSEAVATFLAVLGLIRSNQIRISDDDDLSVVRKEQRH